MRKGERNILVGTAVFILSFMAIKTYFISQEQVEDKDKGIPFYSTAPKSLQQKAATIIRAKNCRDCHLLWAQRNIMQTVPAPSLDGLGSIRDEDWVYQYLSAANPQTILPSRLKEEFKMPSYASLDEDTRRLLAKYISSLKVKDWYLEETKKKEYEKLTGKKYKP